VSEGYLTGDIHWIDPVGEGAVIGAVATGAADISDVEEDVSAEHARVSWDAERSCWLLRGNVQFLAHFDSGIASR